MSERLKELRQLAAVLNRLPRDPEARLNYELMSDALIWSDELPAPSEREGWEANCMRGVFRFRTTLILGKPEEKFREGWELLQKLCPLWPGFLPDRQKPDPAKIRLFEESSAKLLAEWDALDAAFERRSAETTEKPAPAV